MGSRITSKRISKMLEGCFPCAYIMVDNHPFRHDPSHIVTHRIHSSIITFSNHLLNFKCPHKKNGWGTGLHAINLMVIKCFSMCLTYFVNLLLFHVCSFRTFLQCFIVYGTILMNI